MPKPVYNLEPYWSTKDGEMVRLYQGDVIDVLRRLPEKSVHCVVTSPPYWGLRSYLDKDHPDKPIEIGSEPTPQEFVDKMDAMGDEAETI